MKIEKIRTYGWESALMGMRNPKDSWDKSDSAFGLADVEWSDIDYDIAYLWAQEELGKTISYNDEEIDIESLFDQKTNEYDEWLIKNGIINQQDNIIEYAFIGPNDMRLIKSLIKGGPEHRKFLRQIFISVNITAPLYIWKEVDTYKIGTTANSTSTMHTIEKKPITLESFETDDLKFIDEEEEFWVRNNIDHLENLRILYNKLKEEKNPKAKEVWKELIRWLPESWLQTRTITMTYENAFNIKHQRKNHKLTEWHFIIDNFIDKLPYSKDFLGE